MKIIDCHILFTYMLIQLLIFYSLIFEHTHIWTSYFVVFFFIPHNFCIFFFYFVNFTFDFEKTFNVNVKCFILLLLCVFFCIIIYVLISFIKLFMYTMNGWNTNLKITIGLLFISRHALCKPCRKVCVVNKPKHVLENERFYFCTHFKL